jgi:hypothetical protein
MIPFRIYQSTFNKQNNTYSDPVSIPELNQFIMKATSDQLTRTKYLYFERSFNEKVFWER